MRAFFFGLLAWISLSEYCFAEGPSLVLRSGVEAGQMTQDLAVSQWTGLRLGADWSQSWGAGLTARVQGRVLVQVGNHTTTAQLDEFRPRRDLDLMEASVEWIPVGFRPLALRVGALSQEVWRSPLLFGPVAFPGFKQRLKIGSDAFSVSVEAQQALPSGASVGVVVSPETNGLVWLERLRTDSQFQIFGMRLQSHGWIGHFAFQSLSANLSGQAAWGGNSVTNQGIGGTGFSQHFMGIETGGGMSLTHPIGLGLTFSSEGIFNIAAQPDVSKALRLGLGLDVEGRMFGASGFKVQPGVEFFGVESDAVPALYNAREYGHNNRKGWAARLAMEWTQPQLSFEGRVFVSELIDVNRLQSPMDTWAIELRKSYDIL